MTTDGLSGLSKRKTRMQEVVYFECIRGGCEHKTELLAIKCSKAQIRNGNIPSGRDFDISIRVLNGEACGAVSEDYSITSCRVREITLESCRSISKLLPNMFDSWCGLSDLRKAKSIYIYHLNRQMDGRKFISPRLKSFKAIL